MSIIGVASRFSVLKVEDEDKDAKQQANKGNEKQTKSTKSNDGKTKNQSAKNKNSNQSSSANKTNKKQPQNKQQNVDQKKMNLNLKSVADETLLSTSSRVNKNPTKKSSNKTSQWDEWREADEKFVDEQYFLDLREALLLSRKTTDDQEEVPSEVNNRIAGDNNNDNDDDDESHEDQKSKVVVDVDGGGGKSKSKKKKKKTNTVPLDQFLASGSETKSQPVGVREESNNKSKKLSQLPIDNKSKEVHLFNEVEKEAGRILRFEATRESLKAALCDRNAENVLALQYKEELSKKDAEIEKLNAELERLRDEVKLVKVRNKRLCDVIGAGEMREKAEILIQLEKLTATKDELTSEVSELYKTLEQERSKIHSLQCELKKLQYSVSGRKKKRRQ